MPNTFKLTEKEQTVLSSLYKLGDATVSKLAKETLINRTTLYPILEKLLAKGVVSKLTAEGKTVFQPISIDNFKEWIKRQQQNFAREADSLLEWAESQKKEAGGTLLTEIKYFEGVEGVKNLYTDTWRHNKDKMIYGISDYKSAYEAKIMENFFKNEYFPTRIKHGVKIKNLLPESKEGRSEVKIAKSLLREMKFVKLFKDLNIDINIYDSKIAITAFDKEHPTGVLIKNEKIAHAFKNIFEYIWKSVK
jgi:sugar-specific transcriptional regulator TrmB